MNPPAAVQFVLDLFSRGSVPPESPPLRNLPPAVAPPAVAPAPAAPVRPSRRPDDGGPFLGRLQALGLTQITRCRLTNNRRSMVSFRGSELRVHRGYLDAPEPVLRAIVTLVQGRTTAQKRAAARVILAHPVTVTKPRRARREPSHPLDAPIVSRLERAHAELNAARFGGRLHAVSIRVSRMMRSRLGHYSAGDAGLGAEIAISRRHLRKHGWEDAVETLIHEMVHQWQHESGLSIDHGPGFRKKAREVGITPRAKRTPG